MTQPSTSIRTYAEPDADERRPLPAYLAIAAGSILLLESVLILGSRDEVAAAPMVAMYLIGIGLAIAAAVTTGLRQRRGRRALVAVGLSLLVVAWVMALGDLLTPFFELFSKEAYVGDEGPVGVGGLILIGLGVWGGTRRS